MGDETEGLLKRSGGRDARWEAIVDAGQEKQGRDMLLNTPILQRLSLKKDEVTRR